MKGVEKVKKKIILPLFFILLMVVGSITTHAAGSTILTNKKEYDKEVEYELSGFIPEGYKYYFCHQWEYNNDYYIGFYKSEPVMTKELYRDTDYWDHDGYFYHMTESDGSNPLYYRFSSYDDMIKYLVENDASNVEYVYERDSVSYMRVNQSNANTFYSNFDIVFTDGDTYFNKLSYTETRTETVVSDKSYFVDTFDSNYFVNNVTTEFIDIVPVVIVFIVVAIALCKGIQFLFGLIRQA